MALRGCMANVVTLLGAKWRREKTRCPLRGVGTALRPFFWAVGGGEAPSPPFLRESAHYLLFAHPPSPSQGKHSPDRLSRPPPEKSLRIPPLERAKKERKRMYRSKKTKSRYPSPIPQLSTTLGGLGGFLFPGKNQLQGQHTILFFFFAPLLFLFSQRRRQKRHFLH